MIEKPTAWLHTHNVSGQQELTFMDVADLPFNRKNWTSIALYQSPVKAENLMTEVRIPSLTSSADAPPTESILHPLADREKSATRIEIDTLRHALKRLLNEVRLMIENGSLPDFRNGVVFADAHAALGIPSLEPVVRDADALMDSAREKRRHAAVLIKMAAALEQIAYDTADYCGGGEP